MPPPRNDSPRRRNGFSKPHTGAQLSTWVALPTLIAEFVVVVAPILPLEAAIPCTIIFGTTAAIAAYFAFMAQLIDPMDEHLAKHLERQRKGEEPEINGFGGCLGLVGDEVEPMKHCWICETQVAEHAMHCKFCNKCVGNFDHHCLWLNTCVGKANYRCFLFTMVFITAMLVLHCAVQVALIVNIFLGGSAKDRADEWFESGAAVVVAGIFICFAVFDAIALSLILQLLHFHMLLRKEGLTTYKYILRETQRKRENVNQEQARKTHRIRAMGKASDDGKVLLALQLRYGETCIYCDPLPPLEGEKKGEEEDPQHQESNSSQALVYEAVNGLNTELDRNGHGAIGLSDMNRASGKRSEVVFVNVGNGKNAS